MKAKRNIIKIDEDLCNGCGICVEGCHEGALQLIDGKARIISELYCDGLGACIGECPVGAITIEEREAEPYDEVAVMERILPKGEATIIAHLKHLKEHGETRYMQQGMEYLKQYGENINSDSIRKAIHGSQEKSNDMPLACGCPGRMERSFKAPAVSGLSLSKGSCANQSLQSQLSQWPVQLHLLNPQAGYLQDADVVLAADCTAYAYADFHNRFIRNHKLAIACPKLDSNKESYIEKITDMIDSANINTLTVVIMEVPCCGGLLQLAKMAVEKASRKVPVKKIIIGVEGNVVNENWI